MIRRIHLKNFRAFRSHTIYLRPTSVIVGQNNAGKSTIVDALRVISRITERYSRLSLKPAPDWLEAPARTRGVKPSTQALSFDFQNIGHNHSQEPATIRVHFDSGTIINAHIYPAEESIFVTFQEGDEEINTPAGIRSLNIDTVHIMPPIGPIQRRERTLNEDYVRANEWTTLAPLHFRNQLLLFPDQYKVFQEMAETTCPDSELKALNRRREQKKV